MRPDVEYIQAASWENPYHSLFDPEKRDFKRKTMDTRRFDMIFGGQFGKMAGLVYDCFDEDLHVVRPFELPSGTKFYGGIDWGFTDPFALGIRAITPDGHHFRVSEFYKTGITEPQMIEVAKQKMKIFNVEKFFADPSRPDHIEEFNRSGVPCLPANNDIRHGVDQHYELIKSGKYRVFEGTSPYCLDEYAAYHYPEPEDLGPDDDSKEQLPVGQNDHVMDQERYITVMTYRTTTKHAPKAPEDRKDLKTMNHEKRIEMLKRKNRSARGSESWS